MLCIACGWYSHSTRPTLDFAWNPQMQPLALFRTAFVLLAGVFVATVGSSAEPIRDTTCFQIYAPYSPEVDFASDLAIVYGVDSTFLERVRVWREKGYATSMMTGIAWGQYEAYYGNGDAFKKSEVQTRKDGSLFMHHPGVGYNVPTDAYIEFIQQYITPAIDVGVQGIYFEEPEFWALAGWSEGFKAKWLEFYKEPWAEPDSSVDAQYRASKLKYELYFDALEKVFAFSKDRAKTQGRTIECFVPTHSLINYATWRIVSPESHLIDAAGLDGYIAQVWTGTARSQNFYKGVQKERTFETAYLEYGQMWSMVRPTGKKVWFLADPVEDNPNRSWNDYRRNYECTIVASLMFPGVSRFEVMPWPDRIFQGTYPKTDLDTKSTDREGIPSDYATELLTVIGALNEMKQEQIEFDAGTSGIGVLVSDTLMFQRADPSPSDSSLGCFFGLALPLIKEGIPVEIVQLENTLQPGCFDGLRVLLMTYEGQKPLKQAYHTAIAQWVNAGGQLILVDDGSDPYHAVREWWNAEGTNTALAYDDLFAQLGVTYDAAKAQQVVGHGNVLVLPTTPSKLQRTPEGAEAVLQSVRQMLGNTGNTLKTQNYLSLRRGPYVISSVLDESSSDNPLTLRGLYVDLFDASLPIVRERVLAPDTRSLLYDLTWARKNVLSQASPCKVVACAGRVKQETYELASGHPVYTFVSRSPKGATSRARVALPKVPRVITSTPSVDIDFIWDEGSQTGLLTFPGIAEDLSISMTLD